MRILRTNKALSYLAPSLITTGLFVSSTTLAMPLQSALLTTSKPANETVLNTKAETGGLRKNTVLVRNTAAKSEPAPTSTSTKTVVKNQDKKAVSRCWKRLMNMVREIRHAQSTKSN